MTFLRRIFRTPEPVKRGGSVAPARVRNPPKSTRLPKPPPGRRRSAATRRGGGHG